jgi:hypothetical protein
MWDRDAERLCGFQIDDQLVFGRRLHGKVSGLLAFEDPINIGGGARPSYLFSIVLAPFIRSVS